jgi:hypothetical protein
MTGPESTIPLAGFLPPRPGHAKGAGLWVARQLTRQLELVPSPQGGPCGSGSSVLTPAWAWARVCMLRR